MRRSLTRRSMSVDPIDPIDPVDPVDSVGSVDSVHLGEFVVVLCCAVVTKCGYLGLSGKPSVDVGGVRSRCVI
jgi:hypothetical protein